MPDQNKVSADLQSIADAASLDYEKREKVQTGKILPLMMLYTVVTTLLILPRREDSSGLIVAAAFLVYGISQRRLSAFRDSVLHPPTRWREPVVRRWLRVRKASSIAVVVSGIVRVGLLLLPGDTPAPASFMVPIVLAVGAVVLYWSNTTRRSAESQRGTSRSLGSLALFYGAQEQREKLAAGSTATDEAQRWIDETLARRENAHLGVITQGDPIADGAATGSVQQRPGAYARESRNRSGSRENPGLGHLADPEATPLTTKQQLVRNLRWAVRKGALAGLMIAVFTGFQLLVYSPRMVEEHGLSVPGALILAFLAVMVPILLVGILGVWSGGKVRNVLIGTIAAATSVMLYLRIFTGPISEWTETMWQAYLMVSLLFGAVAGITYREKRGV